MNYRFQIRRDGSESGLNLGRLSLTEAEGYLRGVRAAWEKRGPVTEISPRHIQATHPDGAKLEAEIMEDTEPALAPDPARVIFACPRGNRPYTSKTGERLRKLKLDGGGFNR